MEPRADRYKNKQIARLSSLIETETLSQQRFFSLRISCLWSVEVIMGAYGIASLVVPTPKVITVGTNDRLIGVDE